MYETGNEKQKAFERALVGAARVPRITRAHPLVETKQMKKKQKAKEEKQSRKQLQKRVRELEHKDELNGLKEKIRKKQALKREELEKLKAEELRELAVEAEKDPKKRKKEDLIEQLLPHTIRVRLDSEQQQAMIIHDEDE
jgi:hypothetical protein